MSSSRQSGSLTPVARMSPHGPTGEWGPINDYPAAHLNERDARAVDLLLDYPSSGTRDGHLHLSTAFAAEVLPVDALPLNADDRAPAASRGGELLGSPLASASGLLRLLDSWEAEDPAPSLVSRTLARIEELSGETAAAVHPGVGFGGAALRPGFAASPVQPAGKRQ